ncbi:MAG: CBS domain-containing protein [Myxococcota bacterium]
MTTTALDAKDDVVLTVTPDLAVDALCAKLDESAQPGAVVLDEGAVVGVVTEMDLVFRNKNVHLPTIVAILDAVISIDPGGRAKAELHKATAATVAELMSRDVISAAPDTPLSEVADWMVDKSLSIVPIIDEGTLVGAVTRRSAMRAAFRHAD